MRILVTGSKGNIGVELVKYLQNKGHDVLCIDILQKYRENYILCDILNLIDAEKDIQDFKPEVVYHLAAMVSRVTCEKSISMASSVNITGWYQHSICNNRCLNFCVAIYKSDMLDLGGFDERYGWGHSYGDDDFILRVRRKNMNIIQIDNPYVLHQKHDSMAWIPPSNNLHGQKLYEYVRDNELGYKIKNSFLSL